MKWVHKVYLLMRGTMVSNEVIRKLWLYCWVLGSSGECGKWFVCTGRWTDGLTHPPGTWGTIGSWMKTSALVVFCIVVTRNMLLEKMLCMKNSLPWKACPFTLGSVAWCAHCTLGSLTLCDHVAPWELMCRSFCCFSCIWDVSCWGTVGSLVVMTCCDTLLSMLVWQYRSKNAWFMDSGRCCLDKGTTQ